MQNTDKKNRNLLFEELRKETLDIYNRLHSISEDVAFVNSVAQFYSHLPLLPNLRCGAWYTDPGVSSNVPAYFKSTDGHFANWSFNLRRPNLHLMSVAVEHGGLILVDSTRAGKRIPDALSKTVAIWCSVVNRAMTKLYPDSFKTKEWDTELYTPPGAVSAQEHHQIGLRLESWADALASSSYIIPELPHPLRPLWITPSTPTFPTTLSNYLTIICVSASKQVSEGIERRLGGFAYVQGSGDDHELWGQGLTPDLFWKNKENLLNTPRANLPATIAHILDIASGQDSLKAPPTLIPGTRLSLSTIKDIIPLQKTPDFAFIIISSPSSQFFQDKSITRTLLFEVQDGKKSHQDFLKEVLPRSMDFIKKQLDDSIDVCISCPSGRDLSVGVALAALQSFYDDDCKLIADVDAYNNAPVASKSSPFELMIHKIDTICIVTQYPNRQSERVCNGLYPLAQLQIHPARL